MMNDICGQLSFDLFQPADQALCLESKSPAASSQEAELLRTCSDCGSVKRVSEFSLTGWKKTYRSLCKTCRNETARALHQMRKGSTATRASKLVAAAKSRAALKGLPFNLTVQWVQEALDYGVCEATGIAFDLMANRGWNTPSLDQIEPGKGYTTENTRVILFGLNAACGNWGESRVIQMAQAIMKRRRERSEELQRRLTENLKKRTEELGSTLYKLTWKPWVTPSGRSRFRLRASVRRTSETGSTGWPTPTAKGDTTGGGCIGDALKKATGLKRPSGASYGTKLKETVLLCGWTAPTTRDWKDTGADIKPRADGKERFDQLPRQANLAGWPSTTASDSLRSPGQQFTTPNITLNHAAVLAGWATPCARDHFPAHTPEYIAAKKAQGHGMANLNDQVQLAGPARLTATGEMLTGSSAGMESGGQLNPAHSRWLQGLPEAWDECAPIKNPKPRFREKTGAAASDGSKDTGTRSTRKPRASSLKR